MNPWELLTLFQGWTTLSVPSEKKHLSSNFESVRAIAWRSRDQLGQGKVWGGV